MNKLNNNKIKKKQLIFQLSNKITNIILNINYYIYQIIK